MSNVKINNIKSKAQVTFVSDYAGQGQYRTLLPYQFTNSLELTNMMFLTAWVQDADLMKHLSCIRFQRQCTNKQVSIFNRYSNMISSCRLNIKKVYELDDLVDELPSYNNAKNSFDATARSNMLYMMRNVNTVQFSTKFLKDWYESKHGITNGVVVPNMLPSFLWKKKLTVHNIPIKKPKVFYSGSISHYGMGSEFEFILQMIERTYKKYDWVLMSDPKLFHRQLPKQILNNITFIKSCPFYLYPNAMKGANVDIALAPLVDNNFNRGKSNLKLLEYTACGIPSVFSNIDPYYEAPSKIDTLDHCTWEAEIDKLSSNPTYRINILKEQTKVLNKYWLESPANFTQWIDTLI